MKAAKKRRLCLRGRHEGSQGQGWSALRGLSNCGSWCQSRHGHPGRRCIVDLRIAFVRAERLEAKDVEGEL